MAIFAPSFLSFYAATHNFVESGCVWTGDALGSTKAASMTSGVVWINGQRLTVAAVTSRTFTASKDVYVDFQDNGDGTALIAYTDNTTNAASPALANSGTTANTLRNAIVVVGASNIAAATSINQGDPMAILPTVTGSYITVCDTLGNLICNRDPHPKVLGMRRLSADATTSNTTATLASGFTVPVIVGSNTKVKVYITAWAAYSSAGAQIRTSIWNGTVGSGTEIALTAPATGAAGSQLAGGNICQGYQVISGSNTFNGALHSTTATAATIESNGATISTAKGVSTLVVEYF